MRKKVTIQDIADALGISRNTVSKAINNSDGLADATRERILRKAVEMGYKQFSYVNSLTFRSKASAGEQATVPAYQGEIALLTAAFLTQSHFASLMLDKFQREISLLGYTMNTHRIIESDLEARTLPVTFQPDQVKAVICIEVFDRSYGQMICDLGLPVLFVDGPVKRDGVSLPADQLYMDNTYEIIRFVNEMLRLGKRRVGFVGNWNHCQSFLERYAAFRYSMLLGGEPVDERYCIQCNHFADIVERLKNLDTLPDVFICANDFVAADAMRALTSLGWAVPRDVFILGFDDSAESRASRPAMSTVHIHTQIMAYEAVHLLMSRIEEPSLDYRVVHTQTDLIERESTGCYSD